MDIVNFTDGSMTLNLPDLSTLTGIQLLYVALVCNAIYGFVTHFKTLPGVRRYQREYEKTRGSRVAWDKFVAEYSKDRRGNPVNELCKIDEFDIIAAGIYRMTVQFPGRIVLAVLGILGFISTGRINNTCSRLAWGWHLTPQEFAYACNGSKKPST